MERNKLVIAEFLLFTGSVFLFPNVAHSQYLDEFPGMCAYANTNEPLDGHIIRLGQVGQAHGDWAFFFPDERIKGSLQMVNIAENVGLIGQDPDEDLGEMIRARTPPGSFVVAQVFVGDPNMEPVVTCVSEAIPLSQYVPSDYGPDWRWLERDTFAYWLKYPRYNKWRWRTYWRNDFSRIRRGFHGFKDYKYRHPLKRGRRDRVGRDRGRGRGREKIIGSEKGRGFEKGKGREKIIGTEKGRGSMTKMSDRKSIGKGGFEREPLVKEKRTKGGRTLITTKPIKSITITKGKSGGREGFSKMGQTESGSKGGGSTGRSRESEPGSKMGK